MAVENVSEEVKKSVEKILMMICKDLVRVWDERQVETGLQKAALEALGKVHKPDPNKLQDYYRESEKHLKLVVEKIPGTNKHKYDFFQCI